MKNAMQGRAAGRYSSKEKQDGEYFLHRGDEFGNLYP
jgi:hypothetical protein